MKLHLVNGFLGSGKTTAIIAATRYFLDQGKKVGIVTNDKGHYQVDTAFFQSARIPTAQVAGGCFRCSFDEFKNQIFTLSQAASLDILFAESVGSCVDLVNTVFPPLYSIPDMHLEATTFTVFTDIRLFRRWLNGDSLPFSDPIIYTYSKQIDETEVLVLNKVDLLKTEECSSILEKASHRFPEKTIILQSSLPDLPEYPWIKSLEETGYAPKMQNFKVDYTQYMDAEKKMAWFDKAFLVKPADPDGSHRGVIAMIGNLVQALREQKAPVAHLKLFISSSSEAAKVSLTALDFLPVNFSDEWQKEIPPHLAGPLKMVINSRVEMKGYIFGELVDQALKNACSTENMQIEEIGGSVYHPQVIASPNQSQE